MLGVRFVSELGLKNRDEVCELTVFWWWAFLGVWGSSFLKVSSVNG